MCIFVKMFLFITISSVATLNWTLSSPSLYTLSHKKSAYPTHKGVQSFFFLTGWCKCMKLVVYVHCISNWKYLFCLSLLWKERWYYQNCKFSVDIDFDGYSISWLMLKWRNLKKEKMKKKLGNVGQVLVETKYGDPHKEDTGHSTHLLELSGVSTEINPFHQQKQHHFHRHNAVFHRSHSHCLTMTVCEILLSLATSLQTGMT